MSGSSWDYFYQKLDAVALRLIESDPKQFSPEVLEARFMLGGLLRLAAGALHDIEWVDSNDKSPGDELEAISRVLDFHMEKA